MCGPENGIAVPERINCTSNGWNIHPDDYLCLQNPKGPIPRDQILIIVFIMFVVSLITAYQYSSKNDVAKNSILPEIPTKK